ALVAMAGERMHPPGWTEVSAVCTDPAFRGQGLAGRLIQAVAYGIRERGETPFLHAAAGNTGAIRLYESLGFVIRSRPEFFFLHAQGCEVIHLGHDRSVDEVVTAAIQEDAHGVAVSSYQGGHVEYFTYLVQLLRERGAGRIKVFGGGGGVIVPDEIAVLREQGV